MTVFTMDDLYRKMYDLKLLIRNILIKSKRTWDEPRGQIEYDTNIRKSLICLRQWKILPTESTC